MYLSGGDLHSDSGDGRDVQVQVVVVEVGVLVVGQEDVVVAVLKAHVSFEDQVVGHEQGEEGVDTHAREFEELDPLEQLHVLVNDLALLEGEVFVGFRTRDLHKGLVQVHRVVQVSFQSHQPFERGPQDFRVP